MRSKVFHPMSGLKGLLFQPVHASLGDTASVSMGEFFYRFFKGLLENVFFTLPPETSLIRCTSVQDLRKMMKETWLVRLFAILRGPFVCLRLRP